MIDETFKSESDAILNNRLKNFRYWTSIVPKANPYRKDLSWYLNKRNRPHDCEFQSVQDVELQYAPYKEYSEWLSSRGASDSDTGERAELSRANPDVLSDTTTIYPEKTQYSEKQYDAAKSILNNLEDILTENELTIWKLKDVQGLGVGEIADVRGVSPAAISKTLTRIQRKLKVRYEQVCAPQD
jgi:DNA-binding CsgD family transcriptional regulator